MIKTGLTAVIASLLLLTGCGSYAEEHSAVSIQRETASVMMQSDSSNTAAQQAYQNADGMPAAFEMNSGSDRIHGAGCTESLRFSACEADSRGFAGKTI